MKNNKPYISIKVIFKNGEVKKIASRKRRRVFNFIKASNFLNCVTKVTVTYSKGFNNKGVYKNKTDFIHALRAFLESGD